MVNDNLCTNNLKDRDVHVVLLGYTYVCIASHSVYVGLSLMKEELVIQIMISLI